MINKQNLASRKFANALLDADKNASGIAKVIQSIIPQESLLDTLFPPISVTIDQVNTSPDNKYQKFIYYTYTANLGPAYSIGVSEPNLVQTSTNGIGVAYFYPIKLMWSKSEEEIRLFDFRILDEIQELIKTRIGDFKDKVFFYNGINELVRKRDIANETPERVQFINADYYKIIKNIPEANDVIIEPGSVPNSFYDAAGNYHVGAKELISDVKNKLASLGVAPGTFIIPVNYWNKLSTWDFASLGILVGDVLAKGIENVIGNIVFGIGVYRVNKFVEIPSGYTGEVGGYINVNVLGPVFESDIYANSNNQTLIKESAMGYLVPASEMFGVNYVLEPTIVRVESNVITYQKPVVTLYVEYYNAVGVGVSRGFIGFPCRAS